MYDKTIDDGKEKPETIKFYHFTKDWMTDQISRPAEWLLYHHLNFFLLGYGSPIIYLGYS